ncbi:unnamed protein product [Rhodiola kirilowii]
MRRTHEAEQRSRSKSIALANAIDGIRQVLDGLIDLLPRGSDKSSLMQGCADDVKGLLDHIQNICKIEAGVSKLEVEEFNLAHTLEEVADDYQEEMIEKEEGVEVVLDPCDGSVSMFGNVRGDRFKLELIIRSLMTNAVKYTPRGSISIRAWAKRHQLTTSILDDTNRHYWLNWLTRIFFFFFFFFFKDEEDYNKAGMEDDFSAHRRPNCMEYIFEVDDTGTAIPIDEQKSMFENLVLVDDPGFRLGLDAIRSLVKSMGGDIGIVDKEEPGTCFKFNIYLEAAAPTDENLQMADIEVDGLTSLVVLLIQNQERRRVVKRYLERLRIKVLIVKHWEYLQGHLSRLKTKIMPLSQNSNISSDWIVNDYYISRRKCEEPTTTFIMFLIDVSLGPPKELAAMVEEFRSDVSNVVISKVVWLNGGDGHGRVDDVFLSKDLHGSRLQQVVKMLPEFGGGFVSHRQQ